MKEKTADEEGYKKRFFENEDKKSGFMWGIIVGFGAMMIFMGMANSGAQQVEDQTQIQAQPPTVTNSTVVIAMNCNITYQHIIGRSWESINLEGV